MEDDAFDFPGAANVTTVNIQHNNFLALPETLLWNMASLQHFYAQSLVHLATLPEEFFKGKSQLKKLYLQSSFNLGAQERLPDGLFKGLTSLTHLDLSDCQYHRLPNVNDLTALTSLLSIKADLHMGIEGEESESETKFDGLSSVTGLFVGGNFLRRVPSVKNMRSVQTLSLQANRITMIAPGDFRGAIQLNSLLLGNNLIKSVAPQAFVNLASLRVAPDVFNPTNADGSPVLPSYGTGACHSYAKI